MLAGDLLPWSVHGSAREQGLYLLTLSCLALGCLLCVLAIRLPGTDVLAAAVTAGGASGWLLTNGAAEGDTLLVVAEGNGLTVADLAVVPAGLLLGWLAWRRLRTSARARRRDEWPVESLARPYAADSSHSTTVGDMTSDTPIPLAASAGSTASDAEPK